MSQKTRNQASEPQMHIRAAIGSDAERIATLSEELGYPSSLESIQNRLKDLDKDVRSKVFVAVRSQDEIVGWVQVSIRPLLITDLGVEIGGLIVDHSVRRMGVGRALMTEAERWASEMGCHYLFLRSNMIREEAHAFYQELGYESIKTSMTFYKPVDPRVIT